jgi:hypothetical protein
MGLADLLAPGTNKNTADSLARLKPSVYTIDHAVPMSRVPIGTVVPAGSRRLVEVSAWSSSATVAGSLALSAVKESAWPLTGVALGTPQSCSDTTVRNVACGSHDLLNHPAILFGSTANGMACWSPALQSTASASPLQISASASTGTASGGRKVSVGPDGRVIQVADATPHVYSSMWSPLGWSTPVSPASPFGASITDVCISPDGLKVALTSGTSPYLKVYALNADGSWGSAWSNPASLPTVTPTFVGWGRNSDFVVVAGTGASPYLEAWPVTGSAFGTKMTAPTAPASGPNCFDVCMAGDYVAVGLSSTTAYIYPLSASGWGSRTVLTLPYTSPYAVAFSRDGLMIGWGYLTSATPYLTIATFNPSTGAVGSYVNSGPNTFTNTPCALTWIGPYSDWVIHMALNTSNWWWTKHGVREGSVVPMPVSVRRLATMTLPSASAGVFSPVTFELRDGERLWAVAGNVGAHVFGQMWEVPA